MTTTTPDTPSPADPGELDTVALIRATRLRYQRIQQLATWLADPASRSSLPGMAGCMIGVLHLHARDLRTAAAQTRDQGRHQLDRLRAAEAEARGVALDDIDNWIPDPETEHDQEERMTSDQPADGEFLTPGVPVKLATSGWVAAGVGRRTTHRPDAHGNPVPVDEDTTLHGQRMEKGQS